MKKLFSVLLALAAILILSWLIVSEPPSSDQRMVILGVDGLDPILLQRWVDSEHLPNFARLMRDGYFRPLQTTMPPLSPVAWSSFITGMNPGGHGIYDFLHRDPETMVPRLSMARAVPSDWRVSIGSWVFPLSGGRVELLRQGRAFWQTLEEHGISTTMFRMPVNFPPACCSGKALSGMGTPDIRGTPGTFTLYTNNPLKFPADLEGGEVFEVEVIDNQVSTHLTGPENPFRRVRAESGMTHPLLTIDFDVFLDPERSLARFLVQENQFILQQGEWSDWIRLEFVAIPYLFKVSAIGRFYLQEVRPDFRLYVSPLQINPEEPAVPISNPKGWARDLYENLGYFYTQELAEDTKAYSGRVFSGREFWEQTQLVLKEQRRALDFLLEEFRAGLLFFYFSSIDQGSHMLWHNMDEAHPGYFFDELLSVGLRTLYVQIDEALGRVLEEVDEQTTLIVMSDHGFGPFYWGVSLNTWLLEKGYVTLIDPDRQGIEPYFSNVDWASTRAYALGLNSIYVNLKGREKQGIVREGPDYEELLDRLEKDLTAMTDPRNGQKPVSLVVRSRRDFSGAALKQAPDLIIGFQRGYRSSWESPLGSFLPEIFTDNVEPWSGDHGNDFRQVPGVLLTNRQITLEDPALHDLTVAVLDQFGVAKPSEMIGRDCLLNH